MKARCVGFGGDEVGRRSNIAELKTNRNGRKEKSASEIQFVSDVGNSDYQQVSLEQASDGNGNNAYPHFCTHNSRFIGRATSTRPAH